ncbi:MAG: CcoQ/FixQ family Cbb3-type cytochrome c oxidase assembly chaperone [Burkholderiales bacterium]|jgi:cytochrome c oxidase cbb3-type subunit 4|nr:CcoQ/FixQ family Cbb3-type cytochrome c oxidase assembly chaperone [Burkholderiales bacterium]
MSLETARILVMLVSLALFGGIAAWAWSARNRARFDEAARLPFEIEEPETRT